MKPREVPCCSDCDAPLRGTPLRPGEIGVFGGVCNPCRSRRGGRAYSRKAESHRVGRLIDVALAAREKGHSR